MRAVEAARGRGAQAGFTLLEVLISILLVSIGIFGFAKMQALALSDTHVASSRSVVALQAASLAGTLQGNRAYWASASAPASVTIKGSSIANGTGTAAATAASCDADRAPPAPQCTAAQLALSDLQQWAIHMNDLLPSYEATVGCSPGGEPVTCTITVKWIEKYVASTKASVSDSTATGGTRSYTLHVKP